MGKPCSPSSSHSGRPLRKLVCDCVPLSSIVQSRRATEHRLLIDPCPCCDVIPNAAQRNAAVREATACNVDQRVTENRPRRGAQAGDGWLEEEGHIQGWYVLLSVERNVKRGARVRRRDAQKRFKRRKIRAEQRQGISARVGETAAGVKSTAEMSAVNMETRVASDRAEWRRDVADYRHCGCCERNRVVGIILRVQ